MSSIAIESWRFVPHSYAVVNQFQCLAMLEYPDLQLFHTDCTYLDKTWQPQKGLFDAADERRLAAIQTPPIGQQLDAILRIAFPYDLEPAQAKTVGVFGTSECGIVPADRCSREKLASITNNNVCIITPSHWSKLGFIRSGAPPEKVVVIPHGIDPKIYYPLSDAERQQLRQELGWEGFVFLNVSSMLPGKGIAHLIHAFAVVSEIYPEARLILKGSESVYPNGEERIGEILMDLEETAASRVIERLSYIGDSMSFAQLARLYQAADVYVSPYLAEGFNLPVLEAIACGLPVICTKGGPTNDFTTPDFALTIASYRKEATVGTGQKGFVLIPSTEHLICQMRYVIEHLEWTSLARTTGAAYVKEGYTWHHVVDRLTDVLLPASGKVNQKQKHSSFVRMC
jgi:glycosyltransferase involved in cell wall biosynthesis